MWIAIVLIVCGMAVLISLIAGVSDVLGKKALAGGKELQTRLAALEQKLAEQDQSGQERDEQVRRLQGDVAFMTRLLEDRSREPGGAPSGAG